jgi:hypothetical protein
MSDEITSCERCGRELAARQLKEVVYEEGRKRLRLMVCGNCLDQIMNDSQRVRGVVGTTKRAAAHLDPAPGGAERQSLGERG